MWQWVIGAVLLVGAVAGLAIADARSDLDARKREYDNVKREYQTLYREVDGYLGNSRALRSFDKDELERLIKAMCGEDVARDGDEASYVVQKLRDQSIATVRAKWDDISREWDSLEDRLERLMNDVKGTREYTKSVPTDDESIKSERATLLEQLEKLNDDVNKLYATLQDDYRSLANVKEGVMLGANNPRIRAASEHGKRKHVEMQSSYGCHEKEVVLSSGRPDCIRFDKDDCKVIEFKPSSVPSDKARDQARGYVGAIVRYFADDKRAVENCKKDANGSLVFTPVGEHYPACS